MRHHLIRSLRIATLIALLAAPARADHGFVHLRRSPDHGPPGTVIHLDGSGCTLDGRPMERATYKLFRVVKTGQEPYIVRGEAAIADDGTFSADVTVPLDAPPGLWKVGASCYAADMGTSSDRLDFTVIDPNAPPTTVAAPTTTATPPPTTTAPPPTTVPTTTTALRASTTQTSRPTPTTELASHPIDDGSPAASRAPAIAVAALGAGGTAAALLRLRRRRNPDS